MQIVTAAAGRRDGYQVPVALSEAGLLAAHVTDQSEGFLCVGVQLKIVDADVTPVFGQGQGNAPADVALAAGDEGLLAVE